MKVWRIHTKNDIASQYSRSDLVDFCQKEQLIGVGWKEIRTRVDSENAIKQDAKCYSNASAGIKAVNAMRKMQIGDLIWTRQQGQYYLCKVIGLWKDSKPTAIHDELDISNYVNVEWLEIGMEDLVPGKVVSSFRPAASAQTINGVEDISMYLWNKYSGHDTYQLQRLNVDLWSALSAESIEELALLYLQVQYKLFVFSTTMKTTTREYECVMVDSDGKRVFPQVKSGGVSLRADDYMDAIKRDPFARVILFTTSEQYIKNESDNVIYVTRKEIENFILKNKAMLPELTQSWADLCGFYDQI